MSTLSEPLQQTVDSYLALDKNENTRAEIQRLAEAGDEEALSKCLCQRMTFGTAGLRAPMKAGYAFMNDLTIIQTTQGFLAYLQAQLGPAELQRRGVVIGYDARHNSSRFARLAAQTFILANVKVALTSDICPTPFVPFTVQQWGSAAGIMVTASHNPKEDNGYKVYWGNGPQIIPPHDSGIAASIEAHLTPAEHAWDWAAVDTSPLVTDPLPMCSTEYYRAIGIHARRTARNRTDSVRIVYTAMHGVGYRFIQRAFEQFNHTPLIPVTEQVTPDPDFPTVRYPNPEEGKSALNLATATADRHAANVILANDPDADRLAVAERQSDGRTPWRVFTGNETAALFAQWVWRHRSLDDSRASVMLASTVSSKFLRAMARKEGFLFEETLTGFKWMGNRAEVLEKSEGKRVLMAFEEAIGFMVGTQVLDKDGVSAAAVMAEIAKEQYDNGSTLTQLLDELYEKYGYFVSNNSYWLCYDSKTTDRIFEKIRKDQNYPRTIGGVAVVNVRDLTTGYDSAQSDKRAILPSSLTSHMITFEFANGVVATLRTSGTEPKIKYYAELETSDRAGAEERLNDFVANMVDELLEPKANGLTPRST